MSLRNHHEHVLKSNCIPMNPDYLPALSTIICICKNNHAYTVIERRNKTSRKK